MNFSKCPRCQDHCYEQLETHSHCVGCNYSPSFDAESEAIIPEWALRALGSDRLETPQFQIVEGAA